MKIVSLRVLGVFAAALIVVDGGAWYQQGAVYAEYGQGYLQAALVEIFLALAISVKLNSRLANLAINLLTVLLFGLAVSVSALQTALPHWDKISTIERDERIAEVLSDGINQDNANASYMRNHIQSTNLALTTRNQRKERTQLVNVLQQSESDVRFWAGLIAAIALKVVLQLTNLWVFWLAGRLGRENLAVSTVEEEKLSGVDTVSTVEPEVSKSVDVVSTLSPKVLTGVDGISTREEEVLTLSDEPVDRVSTPKTLMDELGLSQTELAKMSGLPRSVISAVVNHYETVMLYLRTVEAEV